MPKGSEVKSGIFMGEYAMMVSYPKAPINIHQTPKKGSIKYIDVLKFCVIIFICISFIFFCFFLSLASFSLSLLIIAFRSSVLNSLTSFWIRLVFSISVNRFLTNEEIKLTNIARPAISNVAIGG